MNVLDDLLANPAKHLRTHLRVTAIGLACGLVLALLLWLVLPARWDARMVVGPAGRGAGPDLSAFLPASESPTIQYLLQRVGSVTAADFSVYEMLLTSPRLASALQDDADTSKTLKQLCRNCAKDAARLARWLSCHVRVQPVGATQMRRVTLRMGYRDVATGLLQALHRTADGIIRADVRTRTDQRIAYLREQLGEVANPDQRDALIGLLKEQERMRMMVGIDTDFSAEVIDPPSLPAGPAFPRLSLLLPLLAVLGASGGFAFGYVRQARA